MRCSSSVHRVRHDLANEQQPHQHFSADQTPLSSYGSRAKKNQVAHGDCQNNGSNPPEGSSSKESVQNYCFSTNFSVQFQKRSRMLWSFEIFGFVLVQMRKWLFVISFKMIVFFG